MASVHGQLFFFGNHKLRLFEITLKHYSEAVCSAQCRWVQLARSWQCSHRWTGWHLETVNTLTSSRLPLISTRCFNSDRVSLLQKP